MNSRKFLSNVVMQEYFDQLNQQKIKFNVEPSRKLQKRKGILRLKFFCQMYSCTTYQSQLEFSVHIQGQNLVERDEYSKDARFFSLSPNICIGLLIFAKWVPVPLKSCCRVQLPILPS